MEIECNNRMNAYDLLSQIIAFDYYDKVQLRIFRLMMEDTLYKVERTIDEWVHDIKEIERSPHSLEQLEEIMNSYFSLLQTRDNILCVIETLDVRLNTEIKEEGYPA